jgi:hypothetical protein
MEIFVIPVNYTVSQKHLTVFELTLYGKGKNFINTNTYILCSWKFMLIITVWIWHFVGDHIVVKYTLTVAVEKMSWHVVAFL